MLETLKSSGVRPGRIKVEVHILNKTEFSERTKHWLDSSQSFSDCLGIKMRPSLRRPVYRLGPFNVWDVKVVC